MHLRRALPCHAAIGFECHMGGINPPAFTAAHQGSTSLPVRAVRMIIPPGLDDEDIIFRKHTQNKQS